MPKETTADDVQTQSSKEAEMKPEAGSTPQTASVVDEIQYMPLKVFADTHALNYGIELMAGFYHEQEIEKHYADTEENWHQLMEQFAKKEVK